MAESERERAELKAQEAESERERGELKAQEAIAEKTKAEYTMRRSEAQRLAALAQAQIDRNGYSDDLALLLAQRESSLRGSQMGMLQIALMQRYERGGPSGLAEGAAEPTEFRQLLPLCVL